VRLPRDARGVQRHRGAQPDADQLAALTGVPAGLWILLFGLAALAALVVGAFWLVP